MPKESSKFDMQKCRAWFYFGVNAVYAASFAFFVFAIWQEPCYTVNGTDVVVTKSVKDATNTSANWNMIMFAAFIVYTLAACSAVSQCFTGIWGQRVQTIDKYINYICIIMFIVLHIMRFTHTL